MSLKKALIGVAAAFALGVAVQSAQAATICNACSYVAAGPATFLGAHNAAATDTSTFQHIFNPKVPGAAFTDYWVFDITPAAFGSASANFTFFTGITNFAGALYADTGSNCPGGPGTACAALAPLGIFMGSDSGNNWELVFNLAPGRYVLVVSGTQRENSAYTGQIAFIPRFVPEPDVLVLLAVGLLAAGFTTRRRAA